MPTALPMPPMEVSVSARRLPLPRRWGAWAVAWAMAVCTVAGIVGCSGTGEYSGRRSLDGDVPAAPHAEPEMPAAAGGTGSANSQPANTESAEPAMEPNGAANGEPAVQPNVRTVETELTAEVALRVRELVADLSPEDPTAAGAERQACLAEQQLVAMGMPIVPALERMSNPSNALTLATIIAQIKMQHEPPPAASTAAAGNESGSANASTSGSANGNESATESTTESTDPPATNEQRETPADPAAAPRSMTTGEMYDALLGQGIGGDTIDERAIGRFLVLKLREMENAAQRQDYARAIALGEAVLTLVPTTQYARQINSRLDYFREMQTQRELLDGRIVAVKPEVPYGEALTFRVVLKNVSQRKLTVVFSHVEAHSRMQNEVYHSPCVLRVKFTQWADARTPIESVRSEYLKAEGKVELNPGEVWSMDWTLDTATVGEQLRAIGEFEVGGVIRPLAVDSVDGAENVRMINCTPATARVLPAAYNSAKADPIGELRASLARQDEVGIALAASAARNAPANVRKRVVEILIENLSNRGRTTRQAVFNGLAAVTGYKLSNEEHWRMWYEANKDKPDLGLGQ